MGYSFIYLFCILILLMLALRFFLPFFIYLFPVLIIIWILKILFGRKRRHQSTSSSDREYYESIYKDDQPTDPNVIDVDYKVVDEEEEDNTH
ncbi:hypothetical protein [Candidatus Stoquefichus sp. SB1]|jgi:hypothetical protein|uniref:hypothetical protein n=1 Tax=Candidatus Stoquefichus sp. SB1 TaxID=1658109 RepID=UPI00067EEA77|nr:hypothetical protein [Candidatus Stoquefichus sp. SB1]